MARPKKSIAEKVQAEFPEFAASVDGAGVAELESKLSTYAKQQEEVEIAMEDDTALEDSKALTSELSGPYRDAKKAIKMKMKYIIALIKDRGGNA